MSDCLFCKIAFKQIPSKMVFENERICAFRDIDPKAPTHILIIPKKHVETVMDITDDDHLWWNQIPFLAQRLAREENIHERGFRLVLNCRNDGGQAVNHLHFHLLGGRKMSWPPG